MSKLIHIQNQIFTFRNVQVMVDRDLATMYQVETKVLNQAVKRNIERFPVSFRFQLTDIEKNELVTNCDRFKSLKHSSVNPYVFTEQGIAMLSAVLRSNIAVQVSIQIMNAFVATRKFISTNAGIFQRIENIEEKQLINDQKFKQGIFFNGQVFDAYVFVADLIKTAKKDLVLIDQQTVYHIGASLKDLGKKWFAFSKMEMPAKTILNNLI